MAHTLDLRHYYDETTSQHFHRNFKVVLHCHHYMAAFIDLAKEFEGDGGPETMMNSAANAFGSFLRLYYLNEGIRDVQERVKIAEQYWKAIGMGLITIETNDSSRAVASMDYSHVDEGWLKKGKRTMSPINFITQGFLRGMMQAVYGGRAQDYKITETNSLALGARKSEFVVEKVKE